MGGDVGLKARVTELERALAAEVEVRQRLVDIVTRLEAPSGRDELLRAIVAAAADVLHAESGSLLLADPATGDLSIAVATGATEPDVARQRIPAGHGIAGWVVAERQAAVVNDPASDPRFFDDLDAASEFETTDLLAVPLLSSDQAVGVLEVVNKLGDEEAFSDDDVALAKAFATLTVIALDRAPR